MLLKRWRSWRHGRILRRARLGESLWEAALADVRGASHLDGSDAARLRDLASLFLHYKSIEPARGLEVTDAMRARIACESCLPILNLGLELYDGWYSVIVYPDEFVAPHEYVDEAGVVHNEDDIRSGEAWDRGPVIISWYDVIHGEAGESVIIHEMAHKLDQLDGAANGRPPLHAGMNAGEWTATFRAAFREFSESVAREEWTEIDPYGAEDPGEFFAVASENFFGAPELLRGTWPGVYEQLSLYYRQDPLRVREPG
jgi:Mlc titration factor MtfA (ptsG expression regulator)